MLGCIVAIKQKIWVRMNNICRFQAYSFLWHHLEVIFPSVTPMYSVTFCITLIVITSRNYWMWYFHGNSTSLKMIRENIAPKIYCKNGQSPRDHLARMYIRTDTRFAPSQWETTLLCNDVSHWLGASLTSALYIYKFRGTRLSQSLPSLWNWNQFSRHAATF